MVALLPMAMTKGDVAGHSFHGNQYVKVGGVSVEIGRTVPTNHSLGVSDWRMRRNPVQRLTTMWQGTFASVHLIRQAMDAQLHGTTLTADTLEYDEARPHSDQTLIDNTTTDDYYSEDDLAKDANATAAYLLDGVEHAPPLKTPIFRGVRLADADLDQLLPGKTVTFGPSSFSSDALVAAEFLDENKQSDLPNRVVIEVDTGTGMKLANIGKGFNQMKEFVSGGSFVVDKIEKGSEVFGVDDTHEFDLVHVHQTSPDVTSIYGGLKKSIADPTPSLAPLDLWDVLSDQECPPEDKPVEKSFGITMLPLARF